MQLEYDWIEAWGRLPRAPEAVVAWPHAGIVVTPFDEIVTFLPQGGGLLVLGPDGDVRRTAETEVAEAHGITLLEGEDGLELWLADAGMQKQPTAGYATDRVATPPSVVRVRLDGKIVQRLDPPPKRFYGKDPYCPTSVAVNEGSRGGDGSIWVADGYGANLVHRYAPDGAYLATLSGDEGGGRFSVPHALFIDRRRDAPELYVADRGNGRIQVYDLDGHFKRVVGEAFLASPTWFAVHQEFLFVVEFRPPRLTVLDSEDRLIARLFEQPEAPNRPGWPNDLASGGELKRTSALRSGRLNSPHAIAVDRRGDLYITEWLIGGRLTKLRRRSD
ncbi:MAG: hypothetical protein M3067_14815 [Chloroflexota bacterium]|nr:hypothetical protein [Chloroflexota bacterium]